MIRNEPIATRRRTILDWLRAPRETLRALRQEREDAEQAWLNAEADAALAEDDEPIPWEQAKRELHAALPPLPTSP